MILCELEVDAHDRLTEAMVLEHRAPATVALLDFLSVITTE